MPRAFEPPLEFGLRAVHDDEVRPHLQNPLDVRIEQRADPRQLLRLRRILVVAADRDDAIAGAHRKQHLGRRRNDRDDAPRLRPDRRGECQGKSRGHRATSDDERQTSLCPVPSFYRAAE